MRTNSKRAFRERLKKRQFVVVIPFEYENKEVLLVRKGSPQKKRLDVLSEQIPPGNTANAVAIELLGRLGYGHSQAAQALAGPVQNSALVLIAPASVMTGETHITCYQVSETLRRVPLGSSGDTIEYTKVGYPNVLARKELSPKLRWLLPLSLDHRSRLQGPILIDEW